MATTCEPESRSGAGHSSAVCDQGVLLNGTEAATQRNSNRPAQIGNKSLRERMITIMAITLVMVGRSLIFRNFMPDREEDPKPGAWDGKGRMSRRTADYTCPARRGSLRVSRCLAFLLGREPDLEVVAQAGSLAEVREALGREFDVAVVDLGRQEDLPQGQEQRGRTPERWIGVPVPDSASRGSGCSPRGRPLRPRTPRSTPPVSSQGRQPQLEVFSLFSMATYVITARGTG